MTNQLTVAPKLSLPLEAVTSTFGLLAVRGAGKTNAARVLAEEMFAAGLPFVAIDPVGSWYGLRAGRDGTSKGGLPVFIFGGEHGDVPLTRGSGELVADVVIERRLACVVDLSRFDSEADRKYFLLAFARRLYQKNKDPLHLFLEEADDYIPQKPMRDEAQLLRAWENIVRRGRSRGIGMTLITQRSAVVNKNVLTQVETLFVLRTTGPQDLAAIEAWTKYHADFGKDALGSLAGLEDGEAWVWSPHFLRRVSKFRFRRSNTFDSGATPANLRGKAKRRVATLAEVDVAKLRDQIGETLEQARQNDPVALKSRIKELERELSKSKQEVTTVSLASADLRSLGSYLDTLQKAAESTETSVNRLAGILGVQAPPQQVATSLASRGGGVSTLIPKKSARAQANLPTTKTEGTRGLKACARAILAVLAQRQGQVSTAQQLSILSGYSVRSSGFSDSLSVLRTNGFMEGTRAGFSITAAGLKAAGPVAPLPSGRGLLEYWQGLVKKCARTILSVLYDAMYLNKQGNHPTEWVSREYIADQSGYSITSSGFSDSLSTLRTLQLVEERTSISGKEMRLSEVFFESTDT